LAYRVHVLSPAKREVRKLDPPTQKSVLSSCLDLGENPRPSGYRGTVGRKDLYRIHAGKYRVICSIHETFESVVIVTVRLKEKDTYRNIPLRALADKLKELEKAVGERIGDKSCPDPNRAK
jgi:mRNA-degrading endonuclease RelE of RelBE toxin-antitoxin system